MAGETELDSLERILMLPRVAGWHSGPICRVWWRSSWWDEIRSRFWHDWFCRNCREATAEKEAHVAWLRDEGGT